MKLINLTSTKNVLRLRTPILIAFTSVLILGGCASSPKTPEGAVAARDKLTQLQNDPTLASKVSVAIRTADTAVKAAEIPRKDKALSDHLVFIAGREVDVAWTQAKTRQLEDQRAGLTEQRNSERLDSRTREADRAQDAAERARMEAEMARQDSDALRRQIAELNAKETERGLVVTLGDTLFETGNSQLKGNAFSNLSKLSNFLNQYPKRTLIIEGHTDSVGNESSNQAIKHYHSDAPIQYASICCNKELPLIASLHLAKVKTFRLQAMIQSLGVH